MHDAFYKSPFWGQAPGVGHLSLHTPGASLLRLQPPENSIGGLTFPPSGNYP